MTPGTLVAIFIITITILALIVWFILKSFPGGW